MIRRLAADGAQSAPEMARFYRVSTETIRRAIRGDTWVELPVAKTERELELEAEESMLRMQQQLAAAHRRKDTVEELLSEASPELDDKLRAFGVKR